MSLERNICLQKADEARQRAAQATEPSNKSAYEKAAEHWMLLARLAPGVPRAQDSLAGDTNLRMGWSSCRHSETVSKMILTEAEAN